MPHTHSAKKRLRQSKKRRLRNRTSIKTIKTSLKRVSALAKGTDLAALRTECRLTTKQLDKAAQRNIVHPNLAARKKSQIARLLNRIEGGTKAAKS